MQNNSANTVHISNDGHQYQETRIVRRNTVSGLSTMVTVRQRCFGCPIDYRVCEFGSCLNKMNSRMLS